MSKDLFDEWAVIELFGHRKVAGKVTEFVIAGKGFLRVDIPEDEREDGNKGQTIFYGPDAVYSIIPVGEDEARAASRVFEFKPVDRIVSVKSLPSRSSSYLFDTVSTPDSFSENDSEEGDEWLPF